MAVFSPEVVRILCSFCEEKEKGHQASYDVFWRASGDAGPYILKLYAGSTQIAVKENVYGTQAEISGLLPEKAPGRIVLYPSGAAEPEGIPVPVCAMAVLKEIICESGQSLYIDYEVQGAAPDLIDLYMEISENKVREISFAPYKQRITTEEAGLNFGSFTWEDSVRSWIECRRKIGAIEIIQKSSEASEFIFKPAAPDVDRLAVHGGRGNCVFFSVYLKKGESPADSYEVLFYQDTQYIRTYAAARENDADVLEIEIPNQDFLMGMDVDAYVTVRSKRGIVCSMESRKYRIVFDTPVVESYGYLNKDEFYVRLNRGSYSGRGYAVLNKGQGEAQEEFSEGCLRAHTAGVKAIKIGWKEGRTYGPACEAFLPLPPLLLAGRSSKGVLYFYYASDVNMASGSGRTVEIAMEAQYAEAVTAGVFTLSVPREGVAQLTFDKKVWPDDGEYDGAAVREDFCSLLMKAEAAGCGMPEVMRIKRLLLKYLPLPAEDQLYYQFGVKEMIVPATGGSGQTRLGTCVSLEAGMGLGMESSRVQWSDDIKQKQYAIGFAGANRVEYPVLVREGRLTFDAFLPSVKKYIQESTQPEQKNRGVVNGGAGVLELAQGVMKNPYAVIFYPVHAPSANGQGDPKAVLNECLVSADCQKRLEQELRYFAEYGYPSPEAEGNAAIVYMRGRVHFTPLVPVWVNGKRETVAAGTILGDIVKMYGQDPAGADGYEVTLHRDGALLSSRVAAHLNWSELLLYTGDQIELRMNGGF